MNPFFVVSTAHTWVDDNNKSCSGPEYSQICKVMAVEEENGLTGYQLEGYEGLYYHMDFRVISDCGYAIAEYIENVHFKSYQYHEAL